MNIDQKLYTYPPLSKNTYSMFAKWNEFNEFSKTFKDIDKFIDYVIFCYDPKSQFRTSYGALADRKRESAIQAGWSLTKNKRFEPEIEEILIGQNEKANFAILAFLQSLGNAEFMALTAYTVMLSTLTFKALGMSDDKDLVNNIPKLVKQIQDSNEIIFGGKEAFEMRKSLYAFMESQKEHVSVEDMAELITNGEEEVIKGWSPYEYSGDKTPSHDHVMKFLGSKPPKK